MNILTILIIGLFVFSAHASASELKCNDMKKHGKGYTSISVDQDKSIIYVTIHNANKDLILSDIISYDQIYAGEVVESSRDRSRGVGESLTYRKVTIIGEITYELYFGYFGRSLSFASNIKIYHDDFLAGWGESYFNGTICKRKN